jgi:TonB family protein
MPEEAAVYTRFRWGKKLAACLALGFFAISLASAGQTVVEEGKRKVKSKAAPIYPELARRMNLGGKVKVEAVIAPDGHVKSARAVGGHPVLVQACVEAMKEWKFDPAPEETTQVVEFDFKQ